MDAITILTSTGVAAVVSGSIQAFFSLRAKQREYVNEYYSVILKRRIAAYEVLEALIIAIKTAVLDTDNRPYHLLFSKDDDWNSAYGLLLNVNTQALWLSDKAFKKGQELNYLIYQPESDGGAIEFGKANYQKIAEIRVDLERIAAEDLLELHDIRSFLQRKRIVETGLRPIQLRNARRIP